MAIRTDPALQAARAIAARELRKPSQDPLAFPRQETFAANVNGVVKSYTCRCNIKDPDRNSGSTTSRAAIISNQLKADYADIRILSVHPDDTAPPKGAVLDGPFDGGRLTVIEWGQRATYSGIVRAICVIRR